MSDKSHHQPNGRFINPWPSFKSHSFFTFFSALVSEWDRKRSQPPDSKTCEGLVQDVDLNLIKQRVEEGARLTWLGHASFLLQLPGCNLLFDPIFSERCSPMQWAGPKRYTRVPCSLKDLTEAVDIDAVVISHNHYDHMDLPTLCGLKEDMTYFVPLGNKSWILNSVSKKANVFECDWWDSNQLKEDVTVTCTPCQHFTGRGLHDRFATLWSSWVVSTPNFKYYFAGDTGYRFVDNGQDEDSVPVCPAFKEIGKKFGYFDLACIPVGAYSPRRVMSPVHCNPEDAVCVHVDINSKKSIGMHHCTFVLTDEPVLDPPIRLREALARRGLPTDQFECMKIGETRSFK